MDYLNAPSRGWQCICNFSSESSCVCVILTHFHALPNGKSSTPILLKDVFYAPDMGITVVSIDRITKAGYSVTF